MSANFQKVTQPIFYVRQGDWAHPPVLLLHGLGADHHMFHPQMTPLVNNGFQVIVPDLPGHGKSAATRFSLASISPILWSLLDDLSIHKISIVGVSLGGLVAQQMTTVQDHRVHRLVLVDSFSSSHQPTAMLQKRLAWLATWMPQSWQGKLIQSTYARLGHPQVGKYFQEQLQTFSQRQLRELRRQINRFDITAEITQINTPTLIMVGDRFGEFAINMARQTATIIPNARFHLLLDGGDPSNLLVPQKFNSALLDFFCLNRKPSELLWIC